MGPRGGLDMVSKRKIPSPRWELNPDHPIVHPVVSRYTDRVIPVSETLVSFHITARSDNPEDHDLTSRSSSGYHFTLKMKAAL
jgi:hypothetical protein